MVFFDSIICTFLNFKSFNIRSPIFSIIEFLLFARVNFFLCTFIDSGQGFVRRFLLEILICNFRFQLDRLAWQTIQRRSFLGICIIMFISFLNITFLGFLFVILRFSGVLLSYFCWSLLWILYRCSGRGKIYLTRLYRGNCALSEG